MSRYSQQPLDFANLKTVGLEERGGKVKVADFAAPYQPGSGIAGLLDSLPHLLAADSFRAVVDALASARQNRRAILWGMGGHVIKCGLAPVLLDLMRRGYATGFALNGSAAIHDFEIALAGHTSEDVEAVLPDGRFGAAEETGREMNRAIVEGDRDGIGMGEALGRALDQRGDRNARSGSQPAAQRLPRHAFRSPYTSPSAPIRRTPIRRPTARPSAAPPIATSASSAAWSRNSTRAASISTSAPPSCCPEVFLKAVSAVRNLGHPLADFTTANFDFLQHYRPRVNVVERPHAASGGKGYAITGHHELMIPLLAAALIEKHP